MDSVIHVPVVTVNPAPVPTDSEIRVLAAMEPVRQETVTDPDSAIARKVAEVKAAMVVVLKAHPAVVLPVRVVTVIVLKAKAATAIVPKAHPAVVLPVRVVMAIVPKAKAATAIVLKAHPVVVLPVKAVLVIVPRHVEAHPVLVAVVKTNLKKPNRLRTINVIFGRATNRQIQLKIKKKPNVVKKTAKALIAVAAGVNPLQSG